MAIAVNGGHVARALDFYDSVGDAYFIVGGTEPWDDESNPPQPSVEDFKLIDIIGLKKVDDIELVIPHAEGTIQHRNQNWKTVPREAKTKITGEGVLAGGFNVPVESVEGLAPGSKVRVANMYEATIVEIVGLELVLDTSSPVDIPAGNILLGGALVEGAKYVYLNCYLEYNNFPTEDRYRQIGLCTGVVPIKSKIDNNDTDILKAAKYNTSTHIDEFESLGILEILDNRLPAYRNDDQRELISLIIEF